MNVYSDSSHLALKYLKNTEVNVSNMLIMTEDFILEIVYRILLFCTILLSVMILLS